MTPRRPDAWTTLTVRRSWTWLAGHRQQFTASWLQALDATLPAGHPIRGLGDGGQVWLLDRLLVAVASGIDPERDVEHALVLEGSWRQAGAELAARGVSATSVGDLGRVLVSALRQACGADWETSLGSAWIGYHLWMCSSVGEGIALAPPRAARAGVPGSGVPGPGAAVDGAAVDGAAVDGVRGRARR